MKQSRKLATSVMTPRLGWKRNALGLCMTAMLFAAVPVSAVSIYSNDFEGTIGPEWSTTSTDATPVGARKFLGQFGNDTASLTLDDLTPHNTLILDFDLFILRSMDGNATTVGSDGIPDGPDVWRLDITGGPTLLSTTFSNNTVFPPNRQNYPDAFPGGDHPAQAGATEQNTLGYTFDYPGPTGTLPADSVYHLRLSFPHTASTVTLNFSAGGLEPLSNESWGIDNVLLAIPEPSALSLMGLGTILMLTYSWLRSRARLGKHSVERPIDRCI
jgi:hypothetical protein